MSAKRFKAKLGGGPGKLFVEVPFDVKKVFGQARAPVKVTIEGYQYRSTTAVYGGQYYLGVRREHREAAHVNLGDTVNVILEPDSEPRTIEAPAELAAALGKSAKARASWEKLSYTHRKEHANAILQAKKPETRARRVQKTIEMLMSR